MHKLSFFCTFAVTIHNWIKMESISAWFYIQMILREDLAFENPTVDLLLFSIIKTRTIAISTTLYAFLFFENVYLKQNKQNVLNSSLFYWNKNSEAYARDVGMSLI